MRNPISPFTYARPNLDISRSKFNRDSTLKTTMSAGLLYPLYVDEYLPGDTFSMDLSMMLRMSTPIHPVMDDAFIDIYWFAVPNRIIWEHWKEFMGESPIDPYLNPVEYSVPQLQRPSDGSSPELLIPYKSVADYMGVPAGTAPYTFNALPFRAFSLIWNEWFRDQNLQNAIDINLGDESLDYVTVSEGIPIGSEYDTSDLYITQTARGGALPPVSKYHDYFTSALRQPQKGDAVPIPLNGFSPVYSIGNTPSSAAVDAAGWQNAPMMINMSGNTAAYNGAIGLTTGSARDGKLMALSGVGTGTPTAVTFGNLYADLGAVGQGDDLNGYALSAYATISDLRYAFQIQKLLEADNRGGTRYREIIKAHFGVSSPDQTMQIPELLGGKRIKINMNQVLQTSATDSTSPQGNTAAYSLTGDMDSAFTKSFTEHGWLICVGALRTVHTYGQGLERMFNRRDRYDFYFPELANISEQPIKNREIFLPLGADWDTESDVIADQNFGFQEAWAEYRYKPSRVSGEFRSTYPQSLDVWHYGDYYESQPYLSDHWIRETRVNIDRTLAVSSDVADQFIGDFYFKCTCVRPMPVASIPGLADHH